MNNKKMIALLKVVKEEVCPRTQEQIDEAIRELREEIAYKNNKASGKGNLSKIAATIIKEAKKFAEENFYGSWIGSDGKQYVSNGFLAIRFSEPMDLETLPDGITSIQMEKIFKNKGKEHYELPTVAEIKSGIAELKAEAKLKNLKSPILIYSFGNGCHVNPEYLLHCVMATGATEATTEGNRNKNGMVVSPLYIDSEDETVESLLLPISVKTGVVFKKGFHLGL